MPRKSRKMPPIGELRKMFNYDPLTGIMRRTGKRRGKVIGDLVGTKNTKGYLICRANYRIFSVHRLAWYLHYGTEPPGIIDHKDGNRSDNRIDNLRAVTESMNRANSKPRSKSHGRGIYWSAHEGKWRSSFRIDGRTRHLGAFERKEDAEEAYRVIAEQQFGEFAYHNRKV